MQEFCRFIGADGREDRRARHLAAARSTAASELGGAEYTFTEDFHEVATFLALGAITGGDVAVRNGAPEHSSR